MEFWTALDYRRAAEEIIRKMPVMTHKQFARSLYLTTGLKEEARVNVMNQLLRDGIILASQNGFITSTESVDTVAVERPVVAFSGKYRIETLKVKPFFLECIDLYNIVLDLYPRSWDFELGRSLYQITFVDKEKNRIYELLRIPHEKESLYKVRVLRESGFTRSKNAQLFKDTIRRIAVVETEAAKMMVPYCGFTNVCAIDDGPKGFKIVEKRNDDIWADC